MKTSENETHLLLEAETLDLVKVETRLRWVDIVCGHASHGLLPELSKTAQVRICSDVILGNGRHDLLPDSY